MLPLMIVHISISFKWEQIEKIKLQKELVSFRMISPVNVGHDIVSGENFSRYIYIVHVPVEPTKVHLVI